MQVEKWYRRWMDGCIDGWVVPWGADTIKLWAPLLLCNIHCGYFTALPVLPTDSDFSWLMVTAFRNYSSMLLSLAQGSGVPTPPLHCTALFAQWLSGGLGLISKQTDLILMPCLQLFSPEPLSTELLSWANSHYMDLVFSWPLPLHFSFCSTNCHSRDKCFFGARDCQLVYIKWAAITIPLQ